MTFLSVVLMLAFGENSSAVGFERPSKTDDVTALVQVVRSTEPMKQQSDPSSRGQNVSRGMISAAALQESQRPIGSNDFGSALWHLAHPQPESKLNSIYVKLLDDEFEPIRGAAASALGILKDKNVAPKIRKLLLALPKTSLDADPPSFDSPPEQTQHENAYATTFATALMEMEDCKSIAAILDRKSISFSWSMLLRPCAETAKPLLIEKARIEDPTKGNVPMTIRALYGKDVLDEALSKRNGKK
jgi:hypothetical protein